MSLEKATITNTDTGDKIKVLFNPEKYSISKSNSFAEITIPGLESPILQFSNGAAQTLTMELFFDSYEKGADVRYYTEKIVKLQMIDSSTKAPPVLLFSYGSVNFTGVLTSVTQNFEMFLRSGIPVRARLNVTFKEYKRADSLLMSSPLDSIGSIALVVIKAVDTISDIASKTIGSAKKWRNIAEANNIDNPRKLVTGASLKIPFL